MKIYNRTVYAVCAAALVAFLFINCDKRPENQAATAAGVSSFRDIPGVTEYEIKSITELQEKNPTLVYASTLSTEAFINEDGEIGGYVALLCDWLSSLFGINFRPGIYEWSELLAKVNSGEIDFCNLKATDERLAVYYMSEPIAERYIRIMRVAGSQPPERAYRRPRYVFLNGSATLGGVYGELEPGSFDSVMVDDYDDVYTVLQNGGADAFIETSISEAAFDSYGDIYAEDFFPLIFTPISMSAMKSELAPLISVVSKALRSGGIRQLTGLYKQGYRDYKRHKLFLRLSDEEKAYLRNGPVIPFASQYYNYPTSFYNANEKEWEGIVFDVLAELKQLTGLEFELVNHNSMALPEMMELLENGTAYMIPDLIPTEARRDRFIWPRNMYLSDTYALLSKWNYPNIEINDIPHEKIGLIRGSAFTELFRNWFPNAIYTREYATVDDAFAGLDHGEVDLLMSGRNRLVSMANYYEFSDYKANFLFYTGYESTFGFNKEQTVLCSVIDKALPLIDTAKISEQWMSKSYDYKSKLMEAQRPWLMGAVVVVLPLLLIVSVFWIRNRSAGIRLEKLVRQRTAELEFEASKLAAIFDSSPDIIFCKDLNSRYIQCNKSYADTYNTRLEEIKGKSDAEIFSYTPETAKKFVEDDKKVISDKHSAVIEESVKLKHLNDKILYLETIKAPLILNGEVIGIIGISRDINRRKEIENELALQTVTLATLVDSIPDFVFTKDTDLRFTQCNKTMVEYLGCRKEDIIGHTDITFIGISPEMAEKHDTLFRQVIETGAILVLEHSMPPYDANSPVFETTHAPIIVNGVITGVLGVGRNITQRKAMEEEVLSASRSKTAFLANMSHEMRTPMNVVIGLTDLMLEETNLPENLRENLKKISTAGSTLLGLINDVLDISKIEAGKLELMPVRYDVPSLLNDIIILNMIRTEDKSISFKLDIDETLFSSLIGDDLRIKQIINNLLSNSFKYTQRGAITFGMRTEREGEDDVWIYVYVSDTGIGIRPEDMSKLFSTYNQVDTRVNRSIVGTGLGLSINKMLVEHMDGEITVESEYGKGTTFRFRIKQKFVNGSTIGAETAENLRGFRYADTKKNVQAKLVRPDLSYAGVLVVDDMQTNLDVAVGLLRKYKMRVDCVNSGQDAIDAIAKGETKYDAVFMDHMMPEMDGVEAAQLIRGLGTEYARTIPIIALTANAIAGNEQMFLENGFQAFLAKPINIMNLDSIVQRWIRDKSRE